MSVVNKDRPDVIDILDECVIVEESLSGSDVNENGIETVEIVENNDMPSNVTIEPRDGADEEIAAGGFKEPIRNEEEIPLRKFSLEIINKRRKKSRGSILAFALIKKSIKCLNKMHVMEDVHEGCNTQQPSSPGHADQRQDMINDMCKKELEENPPESENLNITEIKREDIPNEIKMEIVDNHTPPNEMNGDSGTHHIHEDSSNDNDSGTDISLKRKLEAEANESAMKRLHVEVQRSFSVRDKFLKKCMDNIGGNSFEQIQASTEQIVAEIRTLGELAKQKEKEWNNILHFKKLKEELLLRLERQKQLLLLNLGDFDDESFENSSERYTNDPQRSRNGNHKSKHFNGRSSYNNSIDIGNAHDYRQRIQRPVVDVKSLIADYRQKHPETVPRRGRRIRTNIPQSILKTTGNVLNVSNIALGSGAQVLHNTSSTSDINLSHSESDVNSDLTSFKDMLVEFAKLSQSEKQDILCNNSGKPPPPYPEVTVHPVPTTSTNSNSLLHGILTKNQPTKSETKSTFSPTLARLLTAPEKSSPQTSGNHNVVVSTQGNVASISDILSHSKARNEITITPVMGKYDGVAKNKNHLDEDEQEDSVDRLVIDEGGEMVDGRSKDNNSEDGDVPQCQGCNQRQAQFVCAGCANQWYCSRDCQVAAWDEHSEVCSG
nr:uncharacterized protein LOC111427280 isoform X2 [Onthophagus taurus]